MENTAVLFYDSVAKVEVLSSLESLDISKDAPRELVPGDVVIWGCSEAEEPTGKSWTGKIGRHTTHKEVGYSHLSEGSEVVCQEDVTLSYSLSSEGALTGLDATPIVQSHPERLCPERKLGA